MRRAAAPNIFATADANKDGRVSLAEEQSLALQHFDRDDLNHDGKLTPEERKQARQQFKAQRKTGSRRPVRARRALAFVDRRSGARFAGAISRRDLA